MIRDNDPVRGIQDAILWGWGDGGRLTATLVAEGRMRASAPPSPFSFSPPG